MGGHRNQGEEMGEVVNLFPRKGPGSKVIQGMSMAEILMMQISRHADSAPREVLNSLLEKLAVHIEIDEFIDDQADKEKVLAEIGDDLVCLDYLEAIGRTASTVH